MHRAEAGGPLWPRALYGRALLAYGLGRPTYWPGRGGRVLRRDGVDAEPPSLSLCRQGAAHRRWAGSPKRAPTSRGRARRPRQATRRQSCSPASCWATCARAGRPRSSRRTADAGPRRFRRMRGTLDAGYTLIDLARVRLAQHRLADVVALVAEALADFRKPRGSARRGGSPELPRAGVRGPRPARARAPRAGRGARDCRALGGRALELRAARRTRPGSGARRACRGAG